MQVSQQETQPILTERFNEINLQAIRVVSVHSNLEKAIQQVELLTLNGRLADHFFVYVLSQRITAQIIPLIHDQVSSIGVEQACTWPQRLVHSVEAFPLDPLEAFS